MKRKKVLVNAYFAKNLGDDLFLKVLIDRYPKTSWYLMTPNKGYNKLFKNYQNVQIIRTMDVNLGIRKINLFNKMNESILNYRRYDALVNIGGSIFMESSNWEESLEIRSQLPKKFKQANKQSFIIGANFGPFTDKQFVNKHREFFELFDDICFRDIYSYNLFKKSSNVRYAPDVVFNLHSQERDKEKCIGFSLISLENRKDLKQYADIFCMKMIQLVERYIEDGYKIKLFSFCEKEGDLKISNYIKENISSNYKELISVFNYEENIELFLEEFKRCETIVGARFHSIILALLFKQGVFPIIYSDKTFNVLKDLDMNKLYCHIRDMDAIDVNNVVKNASYNIFNKVGVFQQSEQQFKMLDELLIGKKIRKGSKINES
ncbi:polysaccharide pyruvyl transferase family protein [Bacillus niameyensis]|uniref:polysaccharide pyruvyl transferase family protein n=1 Tax=Bacillus niameyensis TaxID=1522308 RepID=UPI00078050B6|nr:polysaccharide pyruvyl transferase family protein [Bacillus niameyensis]